jgi:thiol-disulfide isomerase/thioredoxin
LALVHDQPGLRAFLALTAYAVGAGVPLLVVGYGGQYAVSSVRSLNRYTGVVKHIAGTLLIFTAIALQWNLLANFQVWLAGTRLATVANTIEDSLFPNQKPGGAASVFEAGGVLPDLGPAPEFKSLGPWHNSEPLPASALKGKVILVDFWTYSCINCIRTLPYIQGYWDRFKEGPFVIVGVHTPEFSFEQDPDNVAAAIKNHGLTYPVAQDNSYGTWRAFSNHYWPAKYLIDANGRIRYEHFGEGGYEETALAIQSLLEEAGYSFAVPKMEPVATAGGRALTPETYLGVRGWSSLVNAPSIPTDEATEYVLPPSVPVNGIALGGQWQMQDDERQVLLSESGSIRIHALAGEVNLVLGVEDEDAAGIPAQVTVDGQPGPTLTIGLHDLYTLFKGAYGEHDIVLTFAKSGVAAYAFTFGE